MVPFWTRARCATALKQCKLRYKMDLTSPKCKRNGRSRHFVLVFIIENPDSSLKSSLGHPWDPRGPASSQMPLMSGTPKMVSAITCAIWLRLIFRGRGSAWFFGAHLLFFDAWGRILEAGGGFWNPEVDILARGRFWSAFGVLKKMVLQRNGFVARIQGNPSCPNEFYGP